MSTTIQKRADELKPGDVWLIRPASRYVVLSAIQEEPGEDVELTTCGVAVGEEAGMRDRVTHSPSRLFEIEAPALSPAQQHAEELRDTLRNLVDALDNGVRYHAHAVQPMKDAESLLAKIDTPVPPTLEETLAALDLAVSDANVKHPDIVPGLALLDRARRAGLLK